MADSSSTLGSSGNKGSDSWAVSTTIGRRPSKAAACGVVTNPKRPTSQRIGTGVVQSVLPRSPNLIACVWVGLQPCIEHVHGSDPTERVVGSAFIGERQHRNLHAVYLYLASVSLQIHWRLP